MAEVRLINNLKGVLHYLNTPLLDFEIKDRELIKAIDLNNGKLLPWELAEFGVTYGNNNLDNYWVKFESFGAKRFEDFM